MLYKFRNKTCRGCVYIRELTDFFSFTGKWIIKGNKKVLSLTYIYDKVLELIQYRVYCKMKDRLQKLAGDINSNITELTWTSFLPLYSQILPRKVWSIVLGIGSISQAMLTTVIICMNCVGRRWFSKDNRTQEDNKN